MRNKLLSLLIGLSLTAIPVLAQDYADSSYDQKRAISELAWISYMEGDAKLNARMARINARVLEGDELYTQEGRVEVYLNGDFLRLNHHTKVVFATLQEESILVDVRYGEVYTQSEKTIDFQTPHENFSLNGVYRIEVDRYDTKKFGNPMFEDDFDKWSYRREQVAERQIYYAEEYEEEEEPDTWRSYPYAGWTGWYPWYPSWGWNPYGYWGDWYYGWHSYWYWSSSYWGWHPYMSWMNWYRYSYYPYYSSYYYSRNYDRNLRYIVRKDQLKRRTIQNQGVRGIRRTAGTATTTSTGSRRGRISKTKVTRSTPSRGTTRRSPPSRTGTIKKKKISSSQSGSIGRTYPSRIQTPVKTSRKKTRATKYSRYYKTGSSYRSPRISSKSYTSRTYSRPSVSRSRSGSSVRSSSGSSVRSSSGSSSRSSSGSSRSASSGKVKKK